MTTVSAPGCQPAVAGGSKNKAHTGEIAWGEPCMGRGGCFYLCITPGYRTVGRPLVRIGLEIQLLPGGPSFKWIPECVNTQEPATKARMRGLDCTSDGDLIIDLVRAPSKEPSVNTLSLDKQIQVLNMLVEGNSIRSIERMTGIHRDTIMRLGARAGTQCAHLLDMKLHNLAVEEIEVDELWCYVQKKQKRVTWKDNPREVGDQWVFVAIDPNTKLIPSFIVGKRSPENALALMRDLQWRTTRRFQLTTDGYRPYINAVEKTFAGGVDYTQLIKVYTGDEKTRERYSPSDFVKSIPTRITGTPDPDKVSTSRVERQNLTMRMSIRRFTRLTNAFSKRLGNLKAAVALHFAHYNFMRVHKSIRVTPAMQAGLTDHIWSWEELLESA